MRRARHGCRSRRCGSGTSAASFVLEVLLVDEHEGDVDRDDAELADRARPSPRHLAQRRLEPEAVDEPVEEVRVAARRGRRRPARPADRPPRGSPAACGPSATTVRTEFCTTRKPTAKAISAAQSRSATGAGRARPTTRQPPHGRWRRRSARTRRPTPRPPAPAARRRGGARRRRRRRGRPAGRRGRAAAADRARQRRPSGARRAHRSDALEQAVEVEGRAHADVGAVRRGRTPRPRGGPRRAAWSGTAHSALSFEDSPSRSMMSPWMRWMRIPAQRAPSPPPASTTWRSTAIMRSSFEQHGVERDLVHPAGDVAGAARRLAPLGGVDLDEEGVLRVAFAHQRRQRRVAAEAAVPVGLAVDLDRLEHRRQAGRGEEHVGRDLVLAEDAAAAGAHVGGGDEELDRPGPRAPRSRSPSAGCRAAGCRRRSA